MHKLTPFLTLLLITGTGYGQGDTAQLNAWETMSLKDLLNVKVVSVSKKAELLFDAPLSASVITKEEIRRAGSTSIMEALRLLPGMIVREQTNGNYDIYLRGMDNVPPNGAFEGNSTTTLVMINNRPIYNYLKGGTFWETLPVDLNDVEKIEVIRGPAAALYGPNAVSGVINIITREIEKVGPYLVANSRQGSYQTFINNVSLGYRFNKKWSLLASGNYQARERTQTSYYEMFRNQWLNDPAYMINYLGDTVTGLTAIYPHPQLAMKKYGGNAFLSYTPTNKIHFDLAAGAQRSLVQKVSTENGMTPLTTVHSDSRYADLRARIKGISAQFSWIDGTQVPDHQSGKYHFNTFDANIEYNYTNGNLSVKPGISYRSAVYDDTKYADTVNRTGIFNARGLMTTTSASLRGEYKLLNNKLRLVAGLMGSKFNYPDTTYLSYEFAVTWKLHQKHLVRAVYSAAPRSSTIYDPYVNQQISLIQTGYRQYILLEMESKKDLRLLTANMLEIGYRGSITSRLHVDIELFDIRSGNYNAIIPNDTYIKLRDADTIVVMPFRATNLPLGLRQQGMTVSFNYSNRKIQVKPFITIQRSVLKHYSQYMNTPGAPAALTNGDPAVNNIYSGIGTKTTVKSTPAAFGGAYINYAPASQWNINLSAYYYSAQTYYHASNAAFNDGIRGIDHIRAKCIINSNISYEAIKGLRFSVSARNILNDKSREFFRSDAVLFMLLGGISYEL
jgi:iron complex outermembrane recepter protein